MDGVDAEGCHILILHEGAARDGVPVRRGTRVPSKDVRRETPGEGVALSWGGAEAVRRANVVIVLVGERAAVWGAVNLRKGGWEGSRAVAVLLV